MDIENVIPTPDDSSKKYQKWFKYAGLAIIALIVLAIIISVISALVPDKFAISGKNSIILSTNDNDERVYVFNGKNMVVIDDEITADINSSTTNYKKTYAVFKTEAGELYVVTSKKSTKVAEDVSTYTLSAFGDKILYISDGDLYYGDISKAAKAKKIDSDVSSVAAVSPDGSAFSYIKADDDDTTCYLCTNGKSGKEYDQKDSIIIALSNKGKYVYYYKESGYYVNDTKLASADEAINSIYFNRDGSQIIYSCEAEDDSKTYMVVNAKEKISLSKGSIVGILAPTGAYSGKYYNVASFKKCVIKIEDGGYYLLKNTKGDTEKLSELNNASGITMLDDQKTVVFVKNDKLRSYNVTKPSSTAKEYDLGMDIRSFDCTLDGKYIYVLDDDKTLYYVKSTSKAQKIRDDVTDFEVVKGGKVYLVTEDDELYYANKSNSVKKILSDDVEGVYYNSLANFAYVRTSDAYYSLSGKKAKKLFNTGN